jgi:fermentation-respiration switch protein FrsA (DUF1100 family)
MTASALAIVAILFAVFVLIWTLQRKVIYFPTSGVVPSPQAVGLSGATVVAFATADGLTLNAWFVKQVEHPWFTVLVFNGNAGNRAFRASLANALAERGIAVLLFDYRGYGGNPGGPTEQGLRADSRGARSYVLARTDVDPKRIAYFGESLGSAVAADLAAEFPPAALILRSPFTTMTEIGQHHYPLLPVAWLLRDRYATFDRIAKIRSPLLVVAGDRDRIVPLEQSRRLYDSAKDPKMLVVIPDADHNDEALNSGPMMIDAIERFLRRIT